MSGSEEDAGQPSKAKAKGKKKAKSRRKRARSPSSDSDEEKIEDEGSGAPLLGQLQSATACYYNVLISSLQPMKELGRSVVVVHRGVSCVLSCYHR